MAGQGLDRIPLRIPERWDPGWFETFVRDVLSLADVRNATEGAGISIEGTSDGPATLAASADVLALLTAPFVTATPQPLLTQSRTLEAGVGVSLDDDGAGGTITINVSGVEWLSILDVPIYVSSVSGDSPAWDFQVDGDVVGYTGIAAANDGIATGSLTGDLVLAPASGRVFVPTKLRVVGAATPTISIADAAGLPDLVMNGTSNILANLGGSTSGAGFVMLQRYNDAGGGPDIGMYHSRAATIGTHTILQSGDEIGSLSFYASDGTVTPVKTARIIGFVNGTVGGAGDLPSRIDILATPGGSATAQTVARFSPEVVQSFANSTRIAQSAPAPNFALIDEAPNLVVERSLKIIRTSAANVVGYAYGSTGTLASPAALSANDLMLDVRARGYDGTSFSFDAANLRMYAAEAWTSTKHGTIVDIWATPLGSITDTLVAVFSTAEVELNATALDFNGPAIIGGAGLGANPLRLIANDATGDCYVSFYRSNESTRKAYLGFGDTLDDHFFVVNEETSSANMYLVVQGGQSINLSANNLSNMQVSLSSSQLTTTVRTVNSSGGFQTTGAASDTGVNAVHAIVDKNGGSARFVGYNWATGVLQPVQISGSTVLITSPTTFDSNPTVSKSNPVFVFNDTSGSATDMLAYTSFQDAANTERGWIGFGEGTTRLQVHNNIGAVRLEGTAIELAGGDVTISNDLVVQGGDLQITVASTAQLRVTSTTTNDARFRFDTSSTQRGFIGFPGATNGIVTGSAVGDLLLRAESGALIFSGDAGSTVHFKVTPAGAASWGGGAAISSSDNIVTGTVTSGTYTPTATGVVNVDSVTANAARWLRVGNTVTVSGSVDIDATTAATQTSVRLTLPVASNLGSSGDLAGAGASDISTNPACVVACLADFTNDAASLVLFPLTTGSVRCWYVYTYIVI